MTRTPNLKERIEENRKLITKMLSGISTHKRLETLNWIPRALLEETQILFQYPSYMPPEEFDDWLDNTSIANLAPTWKYIVKTQKNKIMDNHEIRNIHRMLTRDTTIPGGVYRQSDAYIEQLKIHAPNYQILLQRLDDIQYYLTDERIPVLTRAFNMHYDLIALQPFEDFNKRTARYCMNSFLIKHGYRPIVFNAPSDKFDYMQALRERARGNTKAYSHYMYMCMIRTQEKLIKLLKKSKSM